MLPNVHLTSNSRMSGSRWVITPLWLSGSWRSSFYSSVYSCHFFLISSASFRSILFLSFIESIFAWNIPLVSLTFEEISSLSHSIVFLYFFLHCSLRKAFLSLLAILWNSTFRWVYLDFSPLLFGSLLFSAICKTPLRKPFAFFHWFLLGMALIITSCTMLQTSVHSSPGALSIRSNPLNLFVTSIGES